MSPLQEKQTETYFEIFIFPARLIKIQRDKNALLEKDTLAHAAQRQNGKLEVDNLSVTFETECSCQTSRLPAMME